MSFIKAEAEQDFPARRDNKIGTLIATHQMDKVRRYLSTVHEINHFDTGGARKRSECEE